MSSTFGASTFSYIRTMPALEATRVLREMGFRTIDVLAVPGHLWPSELSGPQRSALRRSWEQDDIVVESVNPQPVDLNLGSCLQEVREYSIRTYADVIGMASELGVRSVVVVPGRVAAMPPDQADTLRWAADSIAALSTVARSAGLEILLENHPASAFPGAEQLCVLMDAFGAGNLKVAYDVANAEYVGEDQVAALVMLGDRLGQTHLSDARPGQWAHDCPGRGTVRFQKILEHLDRADATVTQVVELVSPDPDSDYATAAQVLGIRLQ
jgi:L-ribulose-5-phosphate 3-epimerase